MATQAPARNGNSRPATTTTERPPANGQTVDPNFDRERWLAEQLEKPVNKPVEYKPFGSEDAITLTAGLVLKYLCTPTKSGKVCTQEQAIKFIMLCKARQLNPWEGDAYIIGFDSSDGPNFSLVTAHQAFLKRAEAHPQYDGMESGVIVVRKTVTPAGEEVEEEMELEGDFHRPTDVLVGGWATVYRKDRGRPIYRKVRLSVFNKGYSRWKIDPAGMICKVAEADALRSTFPNNIGGMYLEAEVGPAPVSAAAERVASIKATPRAGSPVFRSEAIPPAATPEPEPIPDTRAADAPADPTGAAPHETGDPDQDPFEGPDQ